ncbi:serine hydrolase domain-containing protein [Myceligenerans crystallogenes]
MPRLAAGAGAAILTVALLAGAAAPATAAPGAAADAVSSAAGVASAGAAAAGAATAGPLAAVGSGETGPENRPELRRALQRLVDAGAVGAQLRVTDENGTWTGTAGRRSLGGHGGVPADGRFRIGSATKTITATIVLQLVAEGRIGLDDPVAGVVPLDGLDPRITVRMLLQHTSGLLSYSGAIDADGTYVPGIAGTLDELMANRLRGHEPEELVRYALDRPARFEPGTAWEYSNTNYTLAVLLVEALTGESYGQQVAERIVRPLGLRDTFAPGDRTAIPGPHAHAYYRFADGHVEDVTRMNPSGFAGAGDLISTTADLGTFATALAAGELLPSALLEEMRTPLAGSGVPVYGEYGLGLFVQDLGPGCGVVVSHNGGLPGYATLMYTSPDGATTLTGSVNYTDDATNSLAPEFIATTAHLTREVFCA